MEKEPRVIHLSSLRKENQRVIAVVAIAFLGVLASLTGGWVQPVDSFSNPNPPIVEQLPVTNLNVLFDPNGDGQITAQDIQQAAWHWHRGGCAAANTNRAGILDQADIVDIQIQTAAWGKPLPQLQLATMVIQDSTNDERVVHLTPDQVETAQRVQQGELEVMPIFHVIGRPDLYGSSTTLILREWAQATNEWDETSISFLEADANEWLTRHVIVTFWGARITAINDTELDLITLAHDHHPCAPM